MKDKCIFAYNEVFKDGLNAMVGTNVYYNVYAYAAAPHREVRRIRFKQLRMIAYLADNLRQRSVRCRSW